MKGKTQTVGHFNGGKNLERRREAGLWEELSDTETANGITQSQMIYSEEGESIVPSQEAILLQSLRKESKGHRTIALADFFQIIVC